MATMKAVRIHAYGGPGSPHHEENVPLPTLEPEDILIRVRGGGQPGGLEDSRGLSARRPAPYPAVDSRLGRVRRGGRGRPCGDRVQGRGRSVRRDPTSSGTAVMPKYIAVKASNAAHKPTRSGPPSRRRRTAGRADRLAVAGRRRPVASRADRADPCRRRRVGSRRCNWPGARARGSSPPPRRSIPAS